MELCAVQTFSKLPNHHGLSTPTPSHSHLLLKPTICLRQTPITRSGDLLSRSAYLVGMSLRAKSEETSDGVSQYFDKKRNGAMTLEHVKTAGSNAFNKAVATEEMKEELPVDEQVQPFDFLDKLDIKFDTDDIGSIVIYGGGAIVALWLASTVVGAIDSIPLFPKLMEVVGLSYTVWFSCRYLLFKRNREELVAKIEELKEQVLGSVDD